MASYLCCPVIRCCHRVTANAEAAERMTDHIVSEHEFPEASASYQAALLTPVAVPSAA